MARRVGILPVPPAQTRRLRIYAMDPLAVGIDNNSIVAPVRYEPLRPGPIGERLEVIDYDPTTDRFYTPVDLDDPHVLAQDGLPPSESDPRFHQQMVYAVASTTLQRFEFALGRRVGWQLRGHRLRIYPHGVQEPNAYFSPELGALVFGYFRAGRSDAGHNLPGGTVFTCLSHDIIAHETTHAVVHGLRDKFTEPTNVDVPAFHEAFADIVAIFQHFSLTGVVEDAIQRTRAQLDAMTPLVELGRQFGEAIGRRGALRSAIGQPPDPAALEHVDEPHERGAILVAAVFAAMIAVYQRRTRDLLRIGTGGTGVLPPGYIAPDLVHRLAKEAAKTARHFLNICIRAIDYCPPIDIEFGEFLRAMITADRDLVPDDPWGYRSALIEAFRERGILPRHVFSLAEDSVVWEPFTANPDQRGLNFSAIRFDRAPYETADPTQYFVLFHRFATRARNQHPFGLDPAVKTQVRSVRPLHRISPDGRIINEIVVELLQAGPQVSDLPGAPPYRGGSTLIVGEHGNVRYAISKRVNDGQRMERQRAYLSDLAAAAGAHNYRKPAFQLTLAHIHRGF